MCIKQLQLELLKVTENYSYSCSCNVTERSHWIPQCGPGNKAADGVLYASHTPYPSRLQHPWPSCSTATTKIKREENPPYENGGEPGHCHCFAFSGKSQYLRIFSMPSYFPNQLYLSYGFCFKAHHQSDNLQNLWPR